MVLASLEEVRRRIWPLVAEDREALFWLECRLAPHDVTLTKDRGRPRGMRLGADGIRQATARASAFYARGGMKVWGCGVLQALSKGLAQRSRLHIDQPV